MFMGAGIQGDRVIGATDDKLFQIPINPATLKTDSENGIRIRPEHIHAALRDFAQIDQHDFSKQFPFVIPKEEQLVGLFGRV